MMDPGRLTERLRAVVGGVRPISAHAVAPAETTIADLHDMEQVLGGQWCQDDGPPCFVVERRTEPDVAHGAQPLKAMAASLTAGMGDASLVSGGAPVQSPLVFFDLETTGLSGGAGTYAFLVGFGAFDDDGGFVTRQFLLVRPADERQLLQRIAAHLVGAGALVTFNGKSFDAPLIETRFLFHRLEWLGSELPHLDVLHPARRFWSDGIGDGISCSLGALETQILGACRQGDVAGFEIPSRYFQFQRTGDAKPLAAVLEHNRLDLVSLAGLAARLFDLVRLGPDAVHDAREALALGRVYARGGLVARARAAYERAVCMGTLSDEGLLEALRSLARLLRRSRRYADAAACWAALLELEAPAHIAREASEALAIHHEHRLRDLHAARMFALRTLNRMEESRSTAWRQAVGHRLARIERKLTATVQAPLFPSWPLPPSSDFLTSARRTSS